MSRNWTEQAGNFGITNGIVVANDSSASIAIVNSAALADASVQADVFLGANQVAGLITRYQSNGSYYVAILQENSTGTGATAYLFKFIAGSGFKQIGAGVAFATTGTGTLRFDVIGTSLKLFFGPTSSALSLMTSAVDTTITTAGFTGIRLFKNAKIDNYQVN